MLLIYYNPHHHCFYTKYTEIFWKPSTHVGYTNQFDHFIVQIIFFDDDDKKVYNVNSLDDYYAQSKIRERNKHTRTVKFKLINKVICLLYKIRDKR